MSDKSKPLVQEDLDPVLVAILATLLNPEGVRNNRGDALRAAVRLIEDARKCLDTKPEWEHQMLPQCFETFWAEEEAKAAEADAKAEEAKNWGFTGQLGEIEPLTVGSFSFDQAVKQTWCSRKTVKGLCKLMRRVDYPFIERRVITEAGFVEAIRREKENKRAADAERKRLTRQKSKKSQNSYLDV
jgi:Arc/MetJ-type ribon-helix-helix transcriptional regulator